jgi:hypothetical protein
MWIYRCLGLLAASLDILPSDPLMALTDACWTISFNSFTQIDTSMASTGALAQRSRKVRRWLTLFFFTAFDSPQRSPTKMQYFDARVTAVYNQFRSAK